MSRKQSKVLENFEEIVLSIFFVTMCVVVVIQIVSRYLFQSPPLFSEELARFCYVWVTFFGMAVATKRENHIRVDLVSMITRSKGEAFVNVLVDIVSLGLYVALAIIGIRYTRMTAIRISPAMEISMALVYVSLPIGAGLSCLRLLEIIRRDIKKLKSE